MSTPELIRHPVKAGVDAEADAGLQATVTLVPVPEGLPPTVTLSLARAAVSLVVRLMVRTSRAQ